MRSLLRGGRRAPASPCTRTAWASRSSRRSRVSPAGSPRSPTTPTSSRRSRAWSALAKSLPFEVDFGKAQNAYYELARTVLPVMRRSADGGSSSAAQWVDRFRALGEKLAVRVERCAMRPMTRRHRPGATAASARRIRSGTLPVGLTPVLEKALRVSGVPEKLLPLFALAHDLRWTWRADIRALFERVDPDAWRRVRGNPVRLFREVSGREALAGGRGSGPAGRRPRDGRPAGRGGPAPSRGTPPPASSWPAGSASRTSRPSSG